MRLLASTADTIVLKYFSSDYPLVMEYIGPDRTHGDGYYNENKYLWVEIFRDVHDNEITMARVGGTPMGIVCITENMFLSFSLHLSVFEVISKGQGDGTAIMGELIQFARDMKYKYFTLQPHDDGVKEFYKKFEFKEVILKKTPIMGLIL